VNDVPPVPGRWQAVRAIARRDLLEFVRDRRTLFVTLLMPMAMYPVLALSSLLSVRASLDDPGAARPPSRLVLAVSGADAIPLVARVRGLSDTVASRAGWPEQLEIEAVAFDAADRMRREGSLDAWIEAPRGTVAGLDALGTVSLEVQLPDVEEVGSRARDHVTAVLRGLADDARRRRVGAAGLPESVLEPVAFTFSGGTAAPGGLSLRGVVPIAAGAVLVLLALLMATGAFYPAIDAIAGEKERGTIETLLMAPCSPGDLVLGKFLAVLAVTLATLAANVVSIGLTMTVLLRFMPAHAALGLDAGTVAAAVAVALPAFVGLAAVAAAMSLAVTAASKSVKEAQNTLTPVILLVSGLAGAALLPGVGSSPWVAAVPFTGQVAVTRSVLFEADESSRRRVGRADEDGRDGSVPLVPLAITLVSSALVSWLLLRATALVVTDEEILFRGPDAVTSGWSRPRPRARPTAWQGFGAALAGFAALWYVQGIAPADLARAILVQQAVAILVPLALLAWWQRVDATTTFALRWPAPDAARGLVATGAAALAGGGLFFLGAAALLAVRGTGMSAEAEALSRRLFGFMRDTPPWQAALLVSVVPALVEETFFRGWILTAFAGRSSPAGRRAFANVAQAALFALFHMLPERMPQTFALGLLLGWLTNRSRSILPAVVGHAVHNAMPLALVAWAGEAAFDAELVSPLSAALPTEIVAAAAVAFAAGVGAFVVATAESAGSHPPR